MPIVKKSEYLNDITYIVDLLIPTTEYTEWKDRITNQLVKNVEVQGFRKGKAPKELALKQINKKYVDEVIYKETLEKFAQDAVTELTAKTGEQKRFIQAIEIEINPEFTGEVEEGFAIRVIGKVLPKVDLSSISSLKFDRAVASDIPNRPTLDEFIEAEKKRFFVVYNTYIPTNSKAVVSNKVICDLKGSLEGEANQKLSNENVEIILGNNDYLPEIEKALMGITENEVKKVKVTFPVEYFEPSVAGKKAEFDITCKSVLKPNFETLEEIIKNNPTASEQFKSEQEFVNFLETFYKDETDRLTEELNQKNIINSAVSTIKDFALPEDRIESETSRIFGVVKADATSKNISLSDALARSGIPVDKNNAGSTEIEIRSQIELYVRREFKLSSILLTIYNELCDNKITDAQLERAVGEIKKNPAQFGLSKDSDDEQIKSITLDKLQRQEGARYLFNIYKKTAPAKEESKKSEPKKEDSKKESKPKPVAKSKK